MAEHTHTGAAELGAPMDYREHERTYNGFLALAKLSIIGTISTLLALGIFAFGGGAGFWLGVLVLIMATIAGVIDLAAKGSVRASVTVMIITIIIFILSVP